jgi:polyphosphate glucokinase
MDDSSRTLCIDIGGSGIKGTVYDPQGKALTERVRIETPRPADPEAVTSTLLEVAKLSGEFDRVTCGFPGVVEEGVVHTAPNLDGDWAAHPLAKEVERRTGKPCKVANDADIQGLAVIEGHGVEMILTLGTGMGCGLYVDGLCVWNLELAHHPFGKGHETYEHRIGEKARKRIGNKKWKKRVLAVVKQLHPIFNFRRLYLGGGNSARLDPAELPEYVTIVDNKAGMLGGLKMWD